MKHHEILSETPGFSANETKPYAEAFEEEVDDIDSVDDNKTSEAQPPLRSNLRGIRRKATARHKHIEEKNTEVATLNLRKRRMEADAHKESSGAQKKFMRAAELINTAEKKQR